MYSSSFKVIDTLLRDEVSPRQMASCARQYSSCPRLVKTLTSMFHGSCQLIPKQLSFLGVIRDLLRYTVTSFEVLETRGLTDKQKVARSECTSRVFLQ